MVSITFAHTLWRELSVRVTTSCRGSRKIQSLAGKLHPSYDMILLQKQWSADWGGQLVISTTPFQVALVIKNPPASAGDVRNAGSIPGLGRSLKRERHHFSSLGKSHGQRRLVGYSPQGHKELNTAESVSTAQGKMQVQESIVLGPLPIGSCQCRRCKKRRFDPWVGKIPEARKAPLQQSWEIPWTEEPGGLQSIGSQRVEHNRECEHSTG